MRTKGADENHNNTVNPDSTIREGETDPGSIDGHNAHGVTGTGPV